MSHCPVSGQVMVPAASVSSHSSTFFEWLTSNVIFY